MGNANYPKLFRASAIALLGLLCIGAALASSAEAAPACTAQIQKTKSGAYEGCQVKMGNREYTIEAGKSSEEGCSQVCSIIAEVGGGGGRNVKSAQVQNTFHE